MNRISLASLGAGSLMIVASLIAILATPSAVSVGHVDLESIIPGEFNGWKVDRSIMSPLVSAEEKGVISQIYNQTLSRTYINERGEQVMLAIAYGADQSTDLQIHRPEVCYATGGFNVGRLVKTQMDTAVGRIPVMQLVAKQGQRNEPITYWIRVGDSLTRGWFEQKLAAFKYGLSGKIPDGLLFRISTISKDEQDSYRIQQAFLDALMQAMHPEDRHWLIGKIAL